MILVDTSVWVRSLSNKSSQQAELDALLAGDAVAGHELVFGELLIGDRGARRAFLPFYETMYQAPTVSHRQVVALVRLHRLHGRGIGWIDSHLLASAQADGHLLWTSDSRLRVIAEELGLAYSPDSSL